MSLTIRLDGMDELVRKMGELPAKKWARGVLLAAGKDIENWTMPYPPPRGGNGRCWYERGFGSRWMRKDGSIHGRQTSEGLGRQWETKADSDGLTVRVGNNASYSPFVHDAERQAGVHAGRWKTLQEAAEKFGPEVIEKIKSAIDEIWSR